MARKLSNKRLRSSTRCSIRGCLSSLSSLIFYLPAFLAVLLVVVVLAVVFFVAALVFDGAVVFFTAVFFVVVFFAGAFFAARDGGAETVPGEPK